MKIEKVKLEHIFFFISVTFAFNKRLIHREPNKIVMDYKYIEQLLERYWDAETTLEEENILRTFFSQQDIPADMEMWRPLFVNEQKEVLGDDFDARILARIGQSEQTTTTVTEHPAVVKAREVKLTQRLMPLFKAAAIVAIILTLGGALQAPWDSTWDDPRDYAKNLQEADTIATVSPIQAENMGDITADSTQVITVTPAKD